MSPEAGTIPGLVERAGERFGERPAFVGRDETLATWGVVAERVRRVAGWMSDQGVAPGERVLVVLPNGVHFAVAVWAALRCGATVVPANPAYTAPELAHLVDDAAPLLVITTAALQPVVDDAVAAAQHTPVVKVALGEAEAGADRSRREDVAVICYTSGTTGRPKGAQLTHANFLSNLEAFTSLPRLDLRADDVLLGVLPFFHIFGLNVILNAAASAGAAVCILERFTPSGSLEAMESAGVSVAFGAPPMFAAWTAAAGIAPPSRLRAAISGADSLPEEVWRGFNDAFGLEIMEGYGLTETAPVLTSTAVSPRVRPGCVGHPLPGVEVRVVDPAGADVAVDVVGEIVARGPNVFIGYHDAPEATQEALRGGWFHTGDLGRLDADGFLTIAGRLKDMVIVSGFNVYPREVELALCSHPAVAEAAVIGVPDTRTGERVVAVVVPEGEPPSVDDLLDHCRQQLTRYKLPRQITFTQKLPRSALGKVQRAALRDDLS